MPLIRTVFSSLQFHYRRYAFTTEASMLNVWAGDSPPARFVIKSHKTGRTVEFILTTTETDRDGNVEALVYYSKDNVYTARIFND